MSKTVPESSVAAPLRPSGAAAGQGRPIVLT
jgi:hypothetical protein